MKKAFKNTTWDILAKLSIEAEQKKKDLVGVSVESPYLEDSFVFRPKATLIPLITSNTQINVEAMPDTSQYKQLDNFVVNLLAGDAGLNMSDKDIQAPQPFEGTIEEENFNNLNPEQYIFEIGLIFETDKTKITYRESTINNIKFTHVKLKRTVGFTEDELVLNLLFKTHTSDSRTFFSDMIGQDLSKKNTNSILEFLSQGLTGTGFVEVGMDIFSGRREKSKRVATFKLTPLEHNIGVLPTEVTRESLTEAWYTFYNGDSTLPINKDILLGSKITKNKDNVYFMNISLRGLGESNLVITLKKL